MVKEKFLKNDLVSWYTKMLLIRRFEEKAGQLYGMGLIGGFCHLYIGQEAIAIGIKHNMKEGDSVITTYRDHGHMIACGSDINAIMAELLGRSGGSSKGKGGSMHLFDIEKKFYGGHGIVGASVPIGAGIAFADKYKERKSVTFCYFGDGASHQGQVYEAFNMAKLWNLPIVFIIENNRYAMGTSVARSSSIDRIHKRGDGFNIPNKFVDGMSIFEVINETKSEIEYVRQGNGPYLIEMDTYRYRGHSMSDPAKYRPKEEVQETKDQKDPINNLKEYILNNNILIEEKIKNIDKEVKEQVAKAVQFAKNSPLPDESELTTNIYN
jgi:pyruvate dehydrogenase E1 component alpha subunit